jgi:hypothetical protein
VAQLQRGAHGQAICPASGNYQSGISVVDFTDAGNAFEVAYADPAPLVNPDNPAAIELGDDWST